jgi:hypothetical protein
MKKFTAKKSMKIAGIVIVAFILVAVGVLFYINYNAGEITDEQLQKVFKNSKLSKVYDLEYDDLKVNILSGSVKLINFKLSPRADFYSGRDSLRFANPVVIDASIPKLTIKGVDIGANFDFSDLRLKSIFIDKPQIKLIEHLSKAEMMKVKAMLSNNLKGKTKKKPSLQKLEIAELILNNGEFNYYNRLDKKTIFKTGAVDILLTNTVLHPGHLIETLLRKSFDKLLIQVKDIYYPLNNGFYDIRCGELDIKLKEDAIGLHNVQVIPKYSKVEFGKAFGKQTDRFDIIVNKLDLVGIGIDELLLENKIEISKIVLTGVDVNIYRDKNIPFDTTKFPPLPHQALGKIKEYIDIGKVELKKSKLLYEELLPDAEVAGRVPISNLYGTIYNVTNSVEVIKKNGPMQWELQGNLFDAGLLSLIVVFPKDMTESSFTFRGGLTEMEMAVFNEYTRQNLHLEITRGRIDSMIYRVNAGSDYSTGVMTMAYKDLKLKVLKKLTEESEKKRGFLSSLANMVVHSNNPHKKSEGPPVSSEIFFVPDKHKAIINYMVKSLINGMIGSFVPAAGPSLEKYEKKQTKVVKKEEHQEKKNTRHTKKEKRKKSRKDKK